MTGREVCGAMNSSPVEALTLMMQLTGWIAHWLKFLVLLTFSPKMTLWYWKREFEVWNFLTRSDIKLVRLPCYIDESLMIFCMALHRVIHFQALAANNTITTSFSTTAIKLLSVSLFALMYLVRAKIHGNVLLELLNFRAHLFNGSLCLFSTIR